MRPGLYLFIYLAPKSRVFLYQNMSEINGQNMTLGTLAGMVQRGFLDVDKKLDLLEGGMNARFDQLEKIIFHEYKNRLKS